MQVKNIKINGKPVKTFALHFDVNGTTVLIYQTFEETTFEAELLGHPGDHHFKADSFDEVVAQVEAELDVSLADFNRKEEDTREVTYWLTELERKCLVAADEAIAAQKGPREGLNDDEVWAYIITDNDKQLQAVLGSLFKKKFLSQVWNTKMGNRVSVTARGHKALEELAAQS